MNFRTEIKIPPSSIKISHQDIIFSIGSCFSANVGQLLYDYKFKITSNPFGVVFNPISIVKQCSRLTHKDLIHMDEVLQIGERWVHYDYHSDLRTNEQEDWISMYEARAIRAQSHLNKANVVIITLGTSIVHRLSNQEVVANCHKQDPTYFTKEMLSIEDSYESLFALIKELSKSVKKVVLTVSPIRHTREGLVNNQRSKSRLIEVANLLASNFDRVDYFPAYEMMMDDLRDYRFYKDDLIHPSEMAIKYIWNRFQEAYFVPSTIALNQSIHKIVQAANHTPFDKDSVSFKSFCNKQIDGIQKLTRTCPEIDLSKELNHFREYAITN